MIGQQQSDHTTNTIVRAPGRSDRAPASARRRRRAVVVALGAGVPLVFIAVWWALSAGAVLDPRLYPSPGDVIDQTRLMAREGDLQNAIGVSGRRILFGYVIGSVAGIAAGFVMGMSFWLRAALEPLLSALYTIPKLAILPVFLTIFGFGEKAIVAVIAVTVFFFVWIATMAAVMNVAPGYREAAFVFNASRWQLVRHVLWPGSLTEIVTSLRVAAGVSVLVLVGVEFVVGDQGLGYVINRGRQLLLLSQTYAGIATVAIVGYLFTTAIGWCGRRLVPWSQAADGLHDVR